MNKRAKFITFEGMDGGGKTTALKHVKEYLKAKHPNIEVIYTREPGSSNSREAELIRQMILDNKNNFSPAVDALLFVTSRRLNLEKCIWPALQENKVVISDRYLHSSLIYQGVLGNLGIDDVRQLNKIALSLGSNKQVMPDLVIYFDLKPEQSLARITNNRQNLDRLEDHELDYYQKLYDGYHKLISQEPDKFKIVDASLPIEEVLKTVTEILENHLVK
ncbi:dTMP kinase [Mycoplasma sp. 3341]|uniref:dTMP kinase n=1 Tax=Mycoplasma sp. 3341 TaxID=3447506 RepID=UPI003F65AF14